MGAGTGVARGAVAGLLVVAVAVAAVVVLTLLVARRRRPYGAISHGVVEVSPPTLRLGSRGLGDPGR